VNPVALPGGMFPLGAVPRDGDTNFAVAPGGDAVQLCLFDDGGAETRITLPDYDAGVWHGFVPGVGPGQACGERVPTGPRSIVVLRGPVSGTEHPRAVG
jgi:isoamylase